jgi:predicted nuclease of restriction endonuclease-like RecB superfamily
MPLPTKVSESFRRLNPQVFGAGTIKEYSTVPNAVRGGLGVNNFAEIANEQPAGPKYRSKWEREFHEILKARFPGAWIEYEPMSLKLADRAKYTPDFGVVDRMNPNPALATKVVFWEVKGHWREAARVRIKVAARLYPWARFIAVVKQKKRDGGGWKEEIFQP